MLTSMDNTGKTVAWSLTLGSRSWSSRRTVRSQPAADVIATLALLIAFVVALMFGALFLLMLPVHLALRAVGRPGIMSGGMSLER
jgi:hypothetical protein